MARRSLSQQLDQAIEALLAPSGTAPPATDARLVELVRLADALRDLPSPEFKNRLKADLTRRTSMTTTTARPIREGFHTITPYLTVANAEALIDFVKQAFGAEERHRGTGSAGGIHAEVRIGDSMLMIGGGGAWRGTPRPTALHLYVKDADAVHAQALRAGGTLLRMPVDQVYGDREGSVIDPAGNFWYIATHQGSYYIPEGLHSVTPFLHVRDTDGFLGFLERALGATESVAHRAPGGTILHAKTRIGDSMLEMGEAHAEFGPNPTTFYLYLENVDSWYRRAVQEGAASMSEPADMPYGDRVAAVSDPFGNTWYGATQVKDVPS